MCVADYMARCLLDPIDGYYVKNPALGVDGDFITAPLISQMFGEMIGVWVAQVWISLDKPANFSLVEIGGGDGTLMSDILRVAARVPGLRDSARVILVEPSEALRILQSQQVPDAIFVPSLDRLPDSQPVIIVTNELLDCLPARQFVRTDAGWYERCVGVKDSKLTFGLVPVAEDFSPPFEAPLGEIIEVSSAQFRLSENLAHLLKAATGAALLIDYGRDSVGTGDTLQALFRHQKRDPLEAPGQDDLTVWADFPTVARAAANARVAVSPIVPQRAFLSRMGIETRHAALVAKNPEQTDKLNRQYERLMAPDQMGTLFKAIGMAYPATIALPGLEAATGSA